MSQLFRIIFRVPVLIQKNELSLKQFSEVSRIIKRLYEDNVNGKISDERFMELSADYEQEQRLSLIHI